MFYCRAARDEIECCRSVQIDRYKIIKRRDNQEGTATSHQLYAFVITVRRPLSGAKSS